MDQGVIYFPSKPAIIASGVVAGPVEKKSVFAKDFDKLYDDERAEEDSNEKGHQTMAEQACQIALQKAKIKQNDVDFLMSGDLVNQMTPSNFAAATLQIPYIGLFSACATAVSSVIIASLLTELGGSRYALAGAGSQHNSVERQFRYPVEYGGQKPGTAQWTVTAAGYVLIAKGQMNSPVVEAATVGKVIDLQQTDPFHMGAAMAPAACDTITRHLKGRGQKLSDYDLIMTGDLGKIGLPILKEMLIKEGMAKQDVQKIRDAGAEYYGDDESFLAGASGAGCSASVFFSYILKQLNEKKMERVLAIATGALLSPLTVQQNESIPCTAHAVEISMK
ncbi:stage V sporulation protein AD [Rummeliibacillus suwonensis]|uniref:stage V sporulation protein AD n=1 Tax=Rummeliibacillus suwonensis TaxID=1306154 RepID=UPI00289C9141|nr:stage V sporulation protein AD [Rummeliibacillus suwonensis]